MQAHIVFPHQLFSETSFPSKEAEIILIEEHLFFKEFPFHKIKLAYHRACMKHFENRLRKKGYRTRYIDCQQTISDIRELPAFLKAEGFSTLSVSDTDDDWLERRLKKACSETGIKLLSMGNPGFINTTSELDTYFIGRKKFFQTDFYVAQRKQRGLLLDSSGGPLGGKWTYDTDNRKPWPKGRQAPELPLLKKDRIWTESTVSIANEFPENPGKLPELPPYPLHHEDAATWLKIFIEERLEDFGPYEDAITIKHSSLHHSVITPMLNTGLLVPEQVLEEVVAYAAKHERIPLASLEGFVRQVAGWREFIRAVYRYKGREERCRNFWNFDRKIPASFWNGTTGILPIDHEIKNLEQTAYSHHIVRLMVIGNFMLLCEFDPDEVYHWFMSMYIDAYDWVMVPNVYGMSQFADGGMMSTKPYISGSNYLMKMSDYAKGPWCEIWDALFWSFMDKQRTFFLSNPRLGMLIRTFDKMEAGKQEKHRSIAKNFLTSLG
jgi:deoxyribodipyrimidine photolyase-related protein